MLELGDDVEPLPFNALRVNADAQTVRAELGARIGIEENRGPQTMSSGTSNLEAGLGHAALLSLQGQSEIANRSMLFHRQGETGMTEAIRATLPYFLGAATIDQALKREQLNAAERELRRASAVLEEAERDAGEIDARLISLVAEAFAAGLLNQPDAPNGEEAIALLRGVLEEVAPVAVLDDEVGRRIHELEDARADSRRRLREAAELRGLLAQQATDEGAYESAVSIEADRLRAIEIIPSLKSTGTAACPVCGSDLGELDPSIADLRRAVDEVTSQLDLVTAVRPRRSAALGDLDREIERQREQLRGVEAALADARRLTTSQEAQATRAEAQAFIKGRIDATLSRLDLAGQSRLLRLRQDVDSRRLRAELIRAEVDPEAEREQLMSRLVTISGDMTEWVGKLELEHAGRAVRIDAVGLTVITDTETGPVPMSRVGSAANWIGYHLVAHLGLHRYFVRQRRPTVRFLMLDQPSQAYYPSEAEKQAGTPHSDADRLAVTRMYELMLSVVQELAPEFQIIVVDHANLSPDWFQASLRENWRDGRKLIPPGWGPTPESA
jgi:hypothetical protein